MSANWIKIGTINLRKINNKFNYLAKRNHTIREISATLLIHQRVATHWFTTADLGDFKFKY